MSKETLVKSGIVTLAAVVGAWFYSEVAAFLP